MSQGKGMGGHHSPTAETDVWITPRPILDALGPFDLDPCAAVTQPWPTAARMLTEQNDGFSQPWAGRIWCNPPYGRETGRWLAKLSDHGCGTALVFARTETDMFFRHVWSRATAILFLRGRLTFHRPDGSPAPANSGAPSCLIAYGTPDAEMLSVCGLPGHLVYPGATP